MSKRRRAAADVALAAYDARNAKLSAEGIKVEESKRREIEENMLRQPLWVEYSGSFFPVIALVFFCAHFYMNRLKFHPAPCCQPCLLVI